MICRPCARARHAECLWPKSCPCQHATPEEAARLVRPVDKSHPEKP